MAISSHFSARNYHMNPLNNQWPHFFALVSLWQCVEKARRMACFLVHPRCEFTAASLSTFPLVSLWQCVGEAHRQACLLVHSRCNFHGSYSHYASLLYLEVVC